jgi:hypothetical protein
LAREGKRVVGDDHEQALFDDLDEYDDLNDDDDDDDGGSRTRGQKQSTSPRQRVTTTKAKGQRRPSLGQLLQPV